MTRTAAAELRADRLSVDRGGLRVISDLSLVVRGGEALLLTGPNGAGKTTLLRTLAGFIRPAEGSVSLTLAHDGDAPAERIHFVGHQNAIKPRLSVRENLAFWQRCLATEAASTSAARGCRLEKALDRLGLGDLGEVPAGYLSAGQRRRLALARLLAVRRPVWLLDEPTVSLDAEAAAAFARMIEEHLAADGIVVAATHVPLGLKSCRELRLERQAVAE